MSGEGNEIGHNKKRSALDERKGEVAEKGSRLEKRIKSDITHLQKSNIKEHAVKSGTKYLMNEERVAREVREHLGDVEKSGLSWRKALLNFIYNQDLIK